MTQKRKAELLLTVGRVLTIIGMGLAFVPLVLAIPGLVLLVLGRASFGIGEELWNTSHHIPCHKPMNDSKTVFYDGAQSVQ